MPRDVVISDEIAPPPAPLSSAVRSHGMTYVSGLIAIDPSTGTLAAGDVTAQTERVLHDLATVLSAAGKSLDDVVRVGVYLTDISTFAAMNAVYQRHFEPPYPARTTICVAALPLAAAVEIDAVAG
jgi:2-iminobutanoate/2-iminopropanoate deaminase